MISGDLARHHDFDAVFRPESESLRPTLPHHAVDNGILILQAKVEMSRCRTLEPGNLATQLHIAETVPHSPFQPGGNFRKAERRRVVPGHPLRSHPARRTITGQRRTEKTLV